MSDQSLPKVTKDELAKWLKGDREKQRLVAERLFVSDRTIDGWRAGRTIPDQYHPPLRRMLNGEDFLLLNLPPEVRLKVAMRAKEKGYSSAEAFLAEFIKGFVALALFGLVAWQAFTPSENSLVRKFGGRRREDAGAALIFDLEA